MNNANKKIALISDYFNLYLINLFIIFIKPQLFSDYQNSSTDVYFNLALDECLLKSDIQDNIFFLWKNFNTIVIGRNQNTIEEINLQAVETDKVNFARRITGGGAVYQDDGNLDSITKA